MEENERPTVALAPAKPADEAPKDSLLKSVISVALFIGAYYLFFSKDVVFILMLVLVLFIHEMGHFLTMKYFGYSDVKMFFIPLLGALVTGNKNEISQRQRAIVLLAGPVPGIAIGALLYMVGVVQQNRELMRVADIFIYVNGFNLIPIIPLDGGNLMETLYLAKREIVQAVFMVLSAIGMCFLAYYLESYVLVIIPFFLLMQVNILFKTRALKQQLDQQQIDYRKPYTEITDQEYQLIRQQVIATMPGFKKIASTSADERDEKRVADFIKTLAIKKPVADLAWWGKLLFLLTWFIFLITPVLIILAARWYRVNYWYM